MLRRVSLLHLNNDYLLMIAKEAIERRVQLHLLFRDRFTRALAFSHAFAKDSGIERQVFPAKRV